MINTNILNNPRDDNHFDVFRSDSTDRRLEHSAKWSA